MTLADLEQIVRNGDEVLLTIKQVGQITNTPYNTVRTWIYRDETLLTEPVGPSFAPRVRGSAVVKLFCGQGSQPSHRCIQLRQSP